MGDGLKFFPTLRKFSRHKKNSRSAAKQFIRMVRRAPDTPTLIQRIAEDRYYLQCCASIFKPDQAKDPFLLRVALDIQNTAKQQKVSYKRLQEMLAPVAVALGLKEADTGEIQSDYYNRLGIPPSASRREIKTAYRSKARTVHPDKETGNSKKFIQIQEAYQALSDHSIRQQYDLSRRDSERANWHEDISISAAANKSFLDKHRFAVSFAVVILLLVASAFLADTISRQHALKQGLQFDLNQTNEALSKEKIGAVQSVQRLKLPPILEFNPNLEALKADEKKSDISTPEAESNESIKENRTSPAGKSVEAAPIKTALIQKPAADVLLSVAQPNYGKGYKGKMARPKPLSVKLKDFLQFYCRAYENQDIDKFRKFFADDAMENGKLFKSLLPRYRDNFEKIDKINYQIDMANYLWDLDQNRVRLDGDFFLAWQKKDQHKLNIYRGKIRMKLIYNQDSFLIENLSYSFE